MNEVWIVSAVRSAVAKGKPDGALAAVHPIDLSAAVMRAATERAGLEPEAIDDVLWGCAMPEAGQGLNVARLSLLRAGFPVSVPGATINRFCSSGLQTVAQGAQTIMSGMAEAVLAGGVEMMSQVPMSGYHTRLHPELTEAYIGMGFTAERVAERWGVSRAAQDAWAYRSHQRALAAQREGRFEAQLVPVETPGGTFAADELPRADTSPAALAKLRPAFKQGGTVTAGNASPYSDGAAALVLVSREKAEALGLRPLARFVSFAVAGVEPEVMGVGPAAAIPKLFARTGVTMEELELIEFNEAFAAQVLAVMAETGMPEAKTNVNGGAIALGHPLGATGAKLSVQLVHELGARGGGLGLVTMCVGGGMGAAGLFEVFARGAGA